MTGSRGSASVRRKNAEANARKRKITQGQSLSARRPGLVETFYDYLDKPFEVFHRAMGADPRTAYQESKKVSGGIEGLFTPRSVERVVRGQGNADDYLNAALVAAPFAAKPAARLLKGAAKVVTPKVVQRGTKAAVKYAARPSYLSDKAAVKAVREGRAADRALAQGHGALSTVAEAAPPQQLALPAPPTMLALPAPGPGLPPSAAKPRGGQFYPDVPIGPTDAQAAGYKLDELMDSYGNDYYQVLRPEGTPVTGHRASTPEGAWKLANTHYQTHNPPSNKSPEAAARMAREEYGLLPYHEDGRPEPQAQLGDWLERTLAKYYKTDFGSPNDPLRDLTERGLHYDATMTPEKWQQAVNDVLTEDPIGYFTVPRHENEIRADLAGQLGADGGFAMHDPAGQGALMQAAPWLRKQPVTDMLYGVRDSLDLGHFVDEMGNAMDPRSGLPMDLAVRPESLGRMTFAQAAEHVGKINRFRAKEMERAALSAQQSPAVQTFKEYTENNPMGLRWTELKAPEGTPAYKSPYGLSADDLAAELEAPIHPGETALREALQYEGDTMGHCVGGYCPDVMSGKSRIFSLRDAKGEPHVTIETRPGRNPTDRFMIPGNVASQQREQARIAARDDTDYAIRLKQIQEDWLANQPPAPDEIIQIKGKQNRAPKDDYLPFVQDFVKSQQWGNVGDLGNTGLVKLPNGKYITQQQYDNVLDSANASDTVRHYLNKLGPNAFDEKQWAPDAWADEIKPIYDMFEGFAIGGRVDADRCFCRHPMSVKR